MPSIKLGLTKVGDNFSLKKVIWCGFICLRKDNRVDPTLSFKTERLGLARFSKSSTTMHTKWSCHPIYKLQIPSMFNTWFYMCMVEFLQLNLEAKFSRKEGLMPIIFHFNHFLFYCFIMLLLLLFWGFCYVVVDICAPSIGCIISWLFSVCVCCKGNIIPRVGRRRG